MFAAGCAICGRPLDPLRATRPSLAARVLARLRRLLGRPALPPG